MQEMRGVAYASEQQHMEPQSHCLQGPMSLSSASQGPLIPILVDVKETQEKPFGNPHLA